MALTTTRASYLPALARRACWLAAAAGLATALQDILILQNKIDLITESAAMNQYDQIKKFIQVGRQGPVDAGREGMGRGRPPRCVGWVLVAWGQAGRQAR